MALSTRDRRDAARPSDDIQVHLVGDDGTVAQALEPHTAKPLDGVAAIEWRVLEEIDPEELAFPSLRMGWERLRGRRG